jgi:hypothetical protein
MVNVTNRAYVDVRLGPRIFLFCHFQLRKVTKLLNKHDQPPQQMHCAGLKNGAHSGNRTRDLSLTKGVLCH